MTEGMNEDYVMRTQLIHQEHFLPSFLIEDGP